VEQLLRSHFQLEGRGLAQLWTDSGMRGKDSNLDKYIHEMSHARNQVLHERGASLSAERLAEFRYCHTALLAALNKAVSHTKTVIHE
jgi:hypothetical protein